MKTISGLLLIVIGIDPDGELPDGLIKREQHDS